MPDDCMRGFQFKDDFVQTDAEKRIADEIFRVQTMDYFQAEAETTKTAALQDTTAPEWDDMVPPDMTDSFDFLL